MFSCLRRKTGTFTALSAFLLLGSCVPWTVRPIDQTDSSSGQARTFDAVRYVDSIWNSRVLPAVAASAVDLREALQAHPAGCLLVKGEGRVLRVDTSSRSGLMLLDLAPYDGRADAAIVRVPHQLDARIGQTLHELRGPVAPREAETRADP